MSKKNKVREKEGNEALDQGIVNEEKAPKTSASKEISLKEYNKKAPFAFDARNYKLLLVGLAINVLGFILMIGGGSDDPNKFSADDLFSTTRITISPILIVTGYIVIMYAIMKKNKKESADSE